MAQNQTIAGLVAGSSDFDILRTALDAAGLTEALDQPDADLTVFAPSDTAFTRLAQDFGYAGDPDDEQAVFEAIAGALSGLSPDGDPIPVLTDVLQYHVSPGAKPLSEVAQLSEVATLLDNATFTPDGTSLVDNDPDAADPQLAVTDVQTSNGIVHVIDRVLLPTDVPGNEANDVKAGTAGSDVIYGNLGNDEVYGNQGDDAVYGNQGVDVVYGNQGDDLVFGGQDSDLVFGGQGDDLVLGGIGDDHVYGNLGNDSLDGNAGNDLLNGGAGNDTLSGGAGSDVFHFEAASGQDTIRDFDGGDTVEIAAGLNGSGIQSFDDLSINDTAAGAEVELGGGNSVLIEGVSASDLSSSDFSIV